MATTKILLFCGLLTLASQASAAANGRAEESLNNKPPSRPGFTLNFPTLPSISLSLPNLPQLPNFSDFSIPNPFPPAVVIKATQTEYVEVTRRQTIHPVCYTAHKLKAPCLPVRQQDRDDTPADFEVNSQLQIHENVNVNRDVPHIEPTKAFRMVETTQMPQPLDVEIDVRNPKYMEFVARRPDKEKEQVKTVEDIIVQTSEGVFNIMRNPFQRHTTEFVTKTVLVTKLERFTDHRVTATMMALNCLPVDPKIPQCHSHKVNPIVDGPVQQLDPIQAADSQISEAVISPSAVVQDTVSAIHKITQDLQDQQPEEEWQAVE